MCLHEISALDDLKAHRSEAECSNYLLPCWLPARKVGGTQMIELDVYYFHWLGTVTSILEGIAPGDTVASGLQRMLFARSALEGFTGHMARAFPLSADSAAELLSAINAVIPPVGSPIPNLNTPIQQHQITRMGALARGLAGSLRDEAKRAYVLKVEDQRCLSSYSLD